MKKISKEVGREGERRVLEEEEMCVCVCEREREREGEEI